MKTNTYKCKHCGKSTERASSKLWIRSWCSDTGKMTRLMMIKEK